MNEFKVRKVICFMSETNGKIKEFEKLWLESLLLRAGVSKIMLNKKLKNQISNEQWRQYLFDSFEFEVENNISQRKVIVRKYYTKEELTKTEVIGEWSAPEIIRKTSNASERPHCEIKFNYWQLV